MKKGSPLAELHQKELIDSAESPDSDGRTMLPPVLEKMVTEVNGPVPETIKANLHSLLAKYVAAVSMDAGILGGQTLSCIP